MKKATILIVLFSFSLIGFSQTFSSSILSGSDYVVNGDIIRFDNKNIIVASETCNGLMGVECTYIFEVNEDNTISFITNIGELELFSKGISSDDEFLTVVGLDENNELKFFKLNTQFEVVNETTHSLGNAPSYWIFDMVAFNDFYVIAIFSIGIAESNFPSLIWVNANDLSLTGTFLIEEHESSLKELTIANNNLKVIKSQNRQHEVMTFDSNMELIDTWNIPQEGNLSFLNFEHTSTGDLLLGLYENQTLVKYDAQGELVWQKNIASQFGAEEIQFIRELKEVSNGDIVICGSLKKDSDQFGFLYSLQSNGVERWKRLYKIDGSATTSPIKSFIELEGRNFMFYGSLRLEPLPAQNTFHDTHWVMRTDSEGCIDTGCGEDLPVQTNEIDKTKISIFPNPTGSFVDLKGLEKYSAKDVFISNLTGRTIFYNNIPEDLIDLGFLESGIYFLQIKIAGNIIFTKKIIKI